MKIALFTPWPPQRSGIADYSRTLLPHLLAHFEVDLWLDEPVSRLAALPCPAVAYSERPDRLGELGGYDAVIYQMGNSLAHFHILQVLLEESGVVVMHDYVLHHLFAAACLERLRDPEAYVKELRYNRGPSGEAMARAALAGRTPPLWEHERPPALNFRVLDHATGVIVHSHYAARLIAASHPHLPLTRLDLPVPLASIPDRAALKMRHGLAAERPLVAILGFASAARRIESLVRAATAFDERQATFLIVGEAGERWRDDLRRMKLDRRIGITGYISEADFDDYCRMTDICVDLRYPTMGESSAVCCRVMGAGGVCIVSDLGWYSELPDDCVVKLPPAAQSELILADCLRELLGNPELRGRIGRAARTLIGDRHRPDNIAAGYFDFIGRIKASRKDNAAAGKVVAELGQALAELGIEGHDRWAIETLAADLDGIGLTAGGPRRS